MFFVCIIEILANGICSKGANQKAFNVGRACNVTIPSDDAWDYLRLFACHFDLSFVLIQSCIFLFVNYLADYVTRNNNIAIYVIRAPCGLDRFADNNNPQPNHTLLPVEQFNRADRCAYWIRMRKFVNRKHKEFVSTFGDAFAFGICSVWLQIVDLICSTDSSMVRAQPGTTHHRTPQWK